jgi:hypothetical protein
MSVMHRTSSKLLAGGLVITMVAVVSTMYVSKVRRDFSEPTAIATGTVLGSGAMLGRRKASGAQSFCWVQYQFSPKGGASRTNWRMWEYACGLKRDGHIPIEYVVASPETNRPPDAVPPVSPLLFWFAAGVMMVIGVIRRGSDATDSGDDEMVRFR